MTIRRRRCGFTRRSGLPDPRNEGLLDENSAADTVDFAARISTPPAGEPTVRGPMLPPCLLPTAARELPVGMAPAFRPTTCRGWLEALIP